MADQPEAPKGLPPSGKQKMALTERERQIILEHRRKTEADRAFNDGLDHAIEVIEGHGFHPDDTEATVKVAMVRRLREAFRDV
jgi:hypothetical protein